MLTGFVLTIEKLMAFTHVTAYSSIMKVPDAVKPLLPARLHGHLVTLQTDSRKRYFLEIWMHYVIGDMPATT